MRGRLRGNAAGFARSAAPSATRLREEPSSAGMTHAHLDILLPAFALTEGSTRALVRDRLGPAARVARRPHMVADPLVFRDLAYVFAAAVLGGALAWLTRQPLILGYVLGGILIGPFTPGPTVSDVHTFELFAEIGVVLLMFAIGIEFSLRDLLRVKWVALVGGPLGIVLSILLGLGVGHLLGWPPVQGVVIGAVISVASTMVLARLSSTAASSRAGTGASWSPSPWSRIWRWWSSRCSCPPSAISRRAGRSGIAIALGKAALILVPVRLSRREGGARDHDPRRSNRKPRALSARRARHRARDGGSHPDRRPLARARRVPRGPLVSDSDYAHETLASLLPLRDVFVAMFFVTIGALVDPGALLVGTCRSSA